jgi:hypothetical protein
MIGDTVYLVLCGYSYEGADVHAVVTTPEEAEALKQRFSAQGPHGYCRFDYVKIEKWTVGEVREDR